jgi:hypothetical protein
MMDDNKLSKIELNCNYDDEFSGDVIELITEFRKQEIKITELQDTLKQREESYCMQDKYAKLGRLFAETLKVETGKYLTTNICKRLQPQIIEKYCGNNCEWMEVCQLRAEFLKDGE